MGSETQSLVNCETQKPETESSSYQCTSIKLGLFEETKPTCVLARTKINLMFWVVGLGGKEKTYIV
jgi:hypothetical protein